VRVEGLVRYGWIAVPLPRSGGTESGHLVSSGRGLCKVTPAMPTGGLSPEYQESGLDPRLGRGKRVVDVLRDRSVGNVELQREIEFFS